MLKIVTAIIAFIVFSCPSKAMDFELVGTGANCDGCSWISAIGEIKHETPDLFREFVKKEQLEGFKNEVVLHSPGGDLSAGIELGILIRQYKFDTRIGRSLLDKAVAPWFFKVEKGKCVSACSFAFLGGVTRSAKNTEIGVHQFYNEYAISNPKLKLFNAADMQTQQIITGILVDYVTSMGVAAEFVSRAAKVPPSQVYYFGISELREFKIASDENDFSEWSLEAFRGGIILNSTNKKATARFYCKSDGKFRLLIFNKEILGKETAYALESYAKFREVVSDIKSVEVFGIKVISRNVSPRISDGVAGIEVTLPPTFLQTISLNKDPNFLVDVYKSVWWMFNYNLSTKSLIKNLTITAKNCIL